VTKTFESAKCYYLAYCIEKAGPQYGVKVTNALPGFSWHQWKEAIDCYWLLDGKAEWSLDKTVDGINGYKLYTNIAKDTGLIAGGNWDKFKDYPHVQLKKGSPLDYYPFTYINNRMRRLYG